MNRIATLLVAPLALGVPRVLKADGCDPTEELCNPIAAPDLVAFVNMLLEAIILIAFPFLVLMIVYCGFLFITAQGNAQKLAEARKVFLWTLIGALLVLGAQALSLAIEATVTEIREATPD
ncbi:hypothetical protein GVX82_03930 [Patescibacteria group bacterium]|jgi:hypothetical protein|nr:hypothetical protein [Patescibacteria group bacterium]